MDVFEPFNRYRCKLQFNRLREDIIQGKIPPPFKVTIELTMRCNLKCRMCFRDSSQKKELSYREFKNLIDRLPQSIREVHLIGGEVFLRKDLFKILDYLEEKDLLIRIHTNGTLLDDEKIKGLSKYTNLLGVGFSIDGPKELHDRIRGMEGAYQKTVEAIQKTSQVLPVSVNTVILKENFEYITDIFNAIKGLGVNEYRLEPEMFCTPEEIEESNAQPIAANIREKGAYTFRAGELKDLKRKLDDLAVDGGIKIVIAPRVAEIDAEEFIEGSLREKKRLFCKHLLVPRVDSEGNLVFCHIIKRRFGNLLENDLDTLWAGEELQDFRKRLLQDNLLPLCKRCCRLRSI